LWWTGGTSGLVSLRGNEEEIVGDIICDGCWCQCQLHKIKKKTIFGEMKPEGFP
jgi:hypothetical protein